MIWSADNNGTQVNDGVAYGMRSPFNSGKRLETLPAGRQNEPIIW